MKRMFLFAAGALWMASLCATPKIAEKNREGLPVILCGDFNSRVESPQIQLAKKTLARAYEISATPPKGPFRTDNCWKFVPPEQEDEKAGNRIDHIFLTPGTKVASYETFGDFYGDNFYPSDHFPIRVLLEWPVGGQRRASRQDQVYVGRTKGM